MKTYSYIELVVSWIETHGYKIISIDSLISRIMNNNYFNQLGSQYSYTELGKLLSDKIIEEQ